MRIERSGVSSAVIALVLLLIMAAGGLSAYFLISSNHGSGSTTSTTAPLSGGTTTASSVFPSSSSTAATTSISSTGGQTSTTSEAASPYGSVVSTLILYNNTLDPGLPDISTSSFSANSSTISIFDMIYDPGNGYLYVSGLNSSAGLVDNGVVLAINPSTDRVVAAIHVSNGDSPDQLAYDSSNGYIYGASSSLDGSNITVIDANSNAMLPNISPYGSAAVPCGGGFYLGGASGIAYDSSANVVYALYGCGDGVSLATFNPASGGLSAGMTLPRYTVLGHMAYDSANRLLYITSNVNSGIAHGNVTVVDPSTSQTISAIPIGDPTESDTFAFDPTNSDLYVVCDSNISVISTTTNTLATTINLPQPTSATSPSLLVGATFDSKNGLVYVTSGSAESILVIDPATNTVAGTLVVNIPTYSISFDPSSGEVYVGDLGFGVVDVVS